MLRGFYNAGQAMLIKQRQLDAIGNNIVNISASSLTTILASRIGGYATGIAAGCLTLIILILGEITPKSIATIQAERMSLIYSPIILFLSYVL